MITLYHAQGSRSMRVLWLCEEMGTPVEIKKVSFADPDPEFIKLSPMQAVPVLIDGDLVMHESVAMMLYIAEKYGPTDLRVTADQAGFGQFLDWLVFSEGTLGAHANPIIRTLFRAPDDQKANWTAGNCVDKLLTGLGALSAALEGRDYIAADRFTMADIALAHAIGTVRGVLGYEDRLAGHVKAYHERLSARPAYQRAMAR